MARELAGRAAERFDTLRGEHVPRSAAMLLPAPGRFSTTICCPSAGPSRWPMTRAAMSAADAGGKPTTTRITFAG